MDIKRISAKYGGLSSRLLRLAEENWRVTCAKKSAQLDQFAGPVACIIVAAYALNEDVDKLKLVKCAGAKKQLIEGTVRKIIDAVGVYNISKTSPDALCIKFGCEALTETVKSVLEAYRAYLTQVTTRNTKTARSKHSMGPIMARMDSQDPIFIAACLYAASKKAQMNVNQEKLLEAVCGNAKEFDAIVSSIEVQCQSSLSGATVDRNKWRDLARDRAARKLTQQLYLDQVEEEKRVKRQKTNCDSDMAQTLTQQRVLEKLRASRGNTLPQNPDVPQKQQEAIATPEEYAEWRAMALRFMHNKMDKEKSENSNMNAA